jgi:hypothetical protein
VDEVPVPGNRGWLNGVRRFLDRRLRQDRVRFVSGAVLGMSLLLLAVAFATASQGRTAFGSDLGADYAQFYVAGTLLDRYPAERLYDFELQRRLYHEVLPGLEEQVQLPYAYPPFIAFVLWPLARLPYAWSFAVWLVLSLSLYSLGLRLLLSRLPSLSGPDRVTAVLLALSFEPFIMECWLGGQLSVLGFFCISLAWYCHQSGRPFAAGLALGVCLYKPTLLVILLPMLAVGRRWGILAGFGVAALSLAGLSVLIAGWQTCLAYTDILFGYARTTAGSTTIFRTWKYMDLNSFIRLLLGDNPALRGALFLAVAGPWLGLLVAAWARSGRRGGVHQQLLWASTLAWTPVANLYVGVYDTIVAVPAALLGAEALYRREDDTGPALPPGFRTALFLLYVVPWFSQHLALAVGFQPYTLVLLALAIYLQVQAGLRTEAP